MYADKITVELTNTKTGEVSQIVMIDTLARNWAIRAVKMKTNGAVCKGKGCDSMKRNLVLTVGGQIFACRVV